MTIIEFQKEATRTMADLGSLLANSIHMTLGMGSELSEFLLALENDDKVNMAEELGDFLWFAVNYATVYGIEILPDFTVMSSQEGPLFTAMVTAGQLQNLDKREHAYGKSSSLAERVELINRAISAVEAVGINEGIDMSEARDRNIDKLKVRYPDKFSNEAALNRDLEAERKALEGNG